MLEFTFHLKTQQEGEKFNSINENYFKPKNITLKTMSAPSTQKISWEESDDVFLKVVDNTLYLLTEDKIMRGILAQTNTNTTIVNHEVVKQVQEYNKYLTLRSNVSSALNNSTNGYNTIRSEKKAPHTGCRGYIFKCASRKTKLDAVEHYTKYESLSSEEIAAMRQWGSNLRKEMIAAIPDTSKSKIHGITDLIQCSGYEITSNNNEETVATPKTYNQLATITPQPPTPVKLDLHTINY